MRDDVWMLVRFLHVLGAAVWVGGMIAIGAVAVPAARAAGDRGAGRRVLTAAARRFGLLGAIAWLALLGTGLALIDHRGLTLADLPDSDYGRRILAKLCLLVGMGIVTTLHALWQGPRVRRAESAGDGRHVAPVAPEDAAHPADATPGDGIARDVRDQAQRAAQAFVGDEPPRREEGHRPLGDRDRLEAGLAQERTPLRRRERPPPVGPKDPAVWDGRPGCCAGPVPRLARDLFCALTEK